MFITSNFHVPVGFSPQKCTERNGHSSNVVAKVSLGRGKSRMDLVPDGEVRATITLPRGKYLKEKKEVTRGDLTTHYPYLSETLHWTCSRKRTELSVPAQPSVVATATAGEPTESGMGAFGAMTRVWQMCCWGSVLQRAAKSDMLAASIRP